ncbi:MAG: porin [Rhizobiales bacterium]|nr:porin [Hyphomicrobiales bacterium]MBO6698319.1 porin [Hyphomicrobiales bacterium]MBO6735427.1 porin [Hyphomicrobiales bacterium]MBO6910765.1 porin [Hyphomicrobiales bacterium]MBO6956774.1 porin [Hyphomicrobiales bacterium]
MTLAKRLLLGSAAAVVATTGAQAADLGLPVAPAVDYVQICSIGSFTGFILPGSDVCFDISGFARFQAEFHSDIVPNNGLDGAGTALLDDEYNFEGIAELNFDARTMTEWGLLRGFIRIDSTGGNNGDGGVLLQKAFVQVGGLTAGYTDSFFDMVYTDYALGPVGAPDGGSTDLGMIGYAYGVGNGVTLMASLEEGQNRNAGIIGDGVTTAGLTFGPVGAADSDESMPDVVVAVRVDQAWGSAKLSAAVTEVDPNDIIAPAAVAVDNEFGWALGASAEFNLPVGYDSNFGVFGIYTDGALGYAGAGAWGFDAVVTGTGSINTTTAYALGAGFEFGLTSMLDLEFDAYYASIDHDFGGAVGDVDVDVMAVRGSLAYVPVAGLEFRAGVGYTTFDNSDLSGATVNANGVLTAFAPAGTTDRDDEFGATFRITRSF